MSICELDGCARETTHNRKVCNTHLARKFRTGSYDLKPRPTPAELFWAKVEKTATCWLWTASVDHAGYGQFGVHPRKVGAHRYAYQALVGPIPEGLELDHLCRVRRCVNPAHLEPVTHAVNMQRGDSFSSRKARQTHCIHGHEFTPENTRRTKRGTRECKACKRERRAAA